MGTGYIADQYKVYRPFEEARKFARSLKLKGSAGWREFNKSGKRPSDIPANPNNTYKDLGWAGFTDFLGTQKK